MAKKTIKFSQFPGPATPIEPTDIVVGLRGGENYQFTEIASSSVLENATFVLKEADPNFPNAQVLDDLPPGVMAVDADGNITSTVISGVPGEIVVTNGDGSTPGPITIGLATPGGGGGGATTKTIIQAVMNFGVGDWLRIDNHPTEVYVLAQANNDTNAETVGVCVAQDLLAGTFTLQQAGWTNVFVGLTKGQVYFLSELVAGEMTTVEPAGSNVSRSVFVADSTTSGWVYPHRPVIESGCLECEGSNGGGGGSNVVVVSGGAAVDFTGADIGKAIYISGTNAYSLAKADDELKARAVGLLVAYTDANNFSYQTAGFSDVFTGLTGGTTYYLSPTTAGALTATKPTQANQWVKPMLVAINAGDGLILEQLPMPIADGVNKIYVNQAASSFVAGDIVYISAANTYAKAQANALATSRAVGIVVWASGTEFVIQTSGFTTAITGKTPGSQYWLSSGTPGAMTTVEPSTSGLVSKPIYVALTADSGYIVEQRPMLQPNANGGAGGGGGGGYGIFGSWTSLATGDLTGLTEVIFNNTLITNAYKYYRISIFNALTSIDLTTPYIIFSANNGATRVGQSDPSGGLAPCFMTSGTNYNQGFRNSGGFGVSVFAGALSFTEVLTNVPGFEFQNIFTFYNLATSGPTNGWQEYMIARYSNVGYAEFLDKAPFILMASQIGIALDAVNYVRLYINQGIFTQGKYALEGANIGI
jgi:hypothetical protein